MADDENNKPPEGRPPLFSRGEIRVLGFVLAFWLYFSYVVPQLIGTLQKQGEILADPLEDMIGISDFITTHLPPIRLLSVFFLYLIAKTYRK